MSLGTSKRPLLEAPDLETGLEHALSFTARFGDQSGALRIGDDGSCSLRMEVSAVGINGRQASPRRSCWPSPQKPYHPLLQVDTAASPCLTCFGGRRYPVFIPASDIVGAMNSGAELSIWHMPLRGKGVAEDKPRRVLRTLPIELGSADEAARGAALLRRLCCWWGRPSPPEVYVIINPGGCSARMAAATAADFYGSTLPAQLCHSQTRSHLQNLGLPSPPQ